MTLPMTWKFDLTPDTAAFTTRQVLSGAPVCLVTHDRADHAWQFLCGTTTDAKDLRIIAMEEAIGIDPGLADLADLPIGWSARRKSPNDKWAYYKNDNGDA